MKMIDQISEATSKFDIQFYKQFSYADDYKMQLAQKGLEEYIMGLDNEKDL